MGISFDAGQLHGFQARLRAIETRGWMTELAQRIGAGFVKLVADEFRTSTDPNGKPWAPVFRNRARDRAARARAVKAGRPVRGSKPLIDTGRMRASVTAMLSQGNLVRIALPVDYAGFHQSGTSRMVRRQILPEGELPPLWRMVAEREANLLLAQKLGVK